LYITRFQPSQFTYVAVLKILIGFTATKYNNIVICNEPMQ